MNPSCFKPNLISLTVIIGILFGASSHGVAQEDTSTLSGRVAGVDGKPIAGVLITIQPLIIIDGELRPAFPQNEFMPEVQASVLKSQTDEAGQFSVTGIKHEPIQFVIQSAHLPDDGSAPPDLNFNSFFEQDPEILSVKIGAVTTYKHQFSPFGGITFAIKPGTHIENVEIIAKFRMRIRGQVVFADGTPLAKARIRINTRRRSLDGRGSGNSSGGSQTDDAGYFVKYVDTPGLYTVTVNHQGLSATPEPFLLQEDERKDDVLFIFESEPISTDAPLGRVEASTSPAPGAGVWVVNPANGHAYKSIRCESWNDANNQAVTEDAYLVSINDAAEQKWLSETFGYRPYWIGLTDLAKEGEWGWTSGEPVTYTNWAPYEPMDTDRGEEDYTFMGHSPNGEWSDVSPESGVWRSIQMAIIERDNPPAKTPTKEK